jgi:proteasome accessory factor B
MQVTETRWHHTQKAEMHRDGSVTLTFQVDGLDEIIWWLLGWSGFAKVIRPDALRERLLEQLRSGIELNSGGESE